MDIAVLDIPILSLMLIVPFVGALITLLMGGKREKFAVYVALLATVATLVMSIYLLLIDSADYGKLDES